MSRPRLRIRIRIRIQKIMIRMRTVNSRDLFATNDKIVNIGNNNNSKYSYFNCYFFDNKFERYRLSRAFNMD